MKLYHRIKSLWKSTGNPLLQIHNQEDSVIINKGAVDRGLLNGCKFTFYKTELDQKEEFGVPDISKTTDIKSASYEKLNEKGVIAIGSRVEKGDAIIGKYMHLPRSTNEQYLYSDRSIIYKDEEPAIVHNIIESYNEEDEKFCKVILRKIRNVVIGDKFCVTDRHEVLTDNGWKFINEITLNDNVATLNHETQELEYQKPTHLYTFDHDGAMYEIKSHGVDLCTTLNHKMYVRRMEQEYGLVKVHKIMGEPVRYKRGATNKFDDIKEFILPADQLKIYAERKFDMEHWLKFFGICLACRVDDQQPNIKIQYNLGRLCEIYKLCEKLNLQYEIHKDYILINDIQLTNYINNWYNYPTLLRLSNKQASIIINTMLVYGSLCDSVAQTRQYKTKNKQIIDMMQIWSILSGYCAYITQKEKLSGKVYTIHISDNIDPLVGGAGTIEQLIDFNGKVYCIEVPNHIFMVRHKNKYVWTGNSSRAGQKGVCGLLLRDSDMPFTKDGLRPSIIFNPHSIPTRINCCASKPVMVC